MPIIQENPTYFTDRVNPSELNHQLPNSKKKNGLIGFARAESPVGVSNNFKRRGPLASDDTDSNELDVFLSSYESNGSHGSSCFTDNEMYPANDNQRVIPFRKESNIEERKGFTQKIGQFFWKSKSKQSIGSETSHASGSTKSSDVGSPKFTPDSSLSICTSSMESGDSSHSSNSNQISPKDRNNRRDRDGNVTIIDDQTAFYRYDDCERYAANMYYNMIGEASSYTCRVQPQHCRPRNNSVPVAQLNTNEIEDCVEPYYNNTTFSTFPNPRRHSTAYSSGSSSTNGTTRKGKNQQLKVIEHDKDGYLRPNEPRNLRNVKNLYYINGPVEYSSHSLSDSSRVQVQVDVHTPTSASSLTSTEFEALNSPKRNYRNRDLETSGETTTGTDDSQSTLVAGGPSAHPNSRSYSRLPFYQNEDGLGTSTTGRRGSNNENNERCSSDKALHPMYMSRVLSTKTDCEPYCSLCASTSTITLSSKKTKMNVAVVSCQECFFSKNAEEHIRTFFDKLVTIDNQKMDVTLQSYDLKGLDHPNIAAEVHRSKVQIVIISHHFLQRLKLEASTRVRLSPVNRVFRPKRVIAVLVGVESNEIKEGYEAVLARFGEWFSVELRSTSKLDPEFCKKFTEQVVKIYNVELCNTSNFSVFPKKVTREQPKIVLMFKKPIDKGDEIRVEFTCGRKTESVASVKMENPYHAVIRVPESLSPDRTALVEVSVYVNNQKFGATWVKSELQTRAGDEDVIERMANMVPGFLNLLDNHISQTLSKNFRDCSDFVTDPTIEIMNDVLICKGDEFPTIMHFAAYYGLEHTVWTLLDEADGIEQSSVLNERGDLALDVAHIRGYDNIVQIIGDYQEINNSWKALKYIKDLCGRASVANLQDSKLVTNKLKIRKQVVTYENVITEDVDNAIREEEEKLESLQAENLQNNVKLLEEPVINSDGSYVNWEAVSEEDPNYTKIVEVLPSKEIEEEKPIFEKPKPSARSPRRKKREYINLKEETRNAENPEKVQIRDREKRNTANRQKRHSIAIEMQNYDIPRLGNEDYSIPPPGTRPVVPAKPKEHDSPILMKKGTGSLPTDEGYLVMNTENSPLPEVNRKESNNHQQYDGDFIPLEALARTDSNLDSDHDRMENRAECTPNSNAEYVPQQPQQPQRSCSVSSQIHKSDENIHLDPIDEELIQLMKDFPSSGYSMQQIELLFENWKSRTDVKRSIEEKKKYMRGLREEYKRIQHLSTGNSKKPSPLERIKVLMKGRKKSTNLPSHIIEDQRENRNPNINQFAEKEQGDEFRKISQSRASDRGSYGSHESGGSGSVPDSGVSEPDSEKDKEADKVFEGTCNKVEDPDNTKPLVWNDPLNKRFCPSYIPPEPLKLELIEGNNNVSHEKDDSSYKVPPPPRPVTNLPSGSTPPQSPSHSSTPPPPPQKPSHMRQKQDDSCDSPPPPPPRTYKLPNVFSYIDYKSKSKEPPGSPEINRSAKPAYPAPRPPYDNLTKFSK